MSWIKRRARLLGLNILHRIGESGAKYTICPMPGFLSRSAGVTVAFGGGWETYCSGERLHRIPPGSAHYLEHVLFKKNGINIADEISSRGGNCNAETGLSSTSYYIESVTDFDENLNSLFEIVFRSGLSEEIVEAERGIILAEHYEYLDSPQLRNHMALRRAMYGECNYTYDLTGTPESIKAMSASQLEEVFRAFYAPPNLHFVAVGDLDPDELYGRFEAFALRVASGMVAKGASLAISDEPKAQNVTLKDSVAMPIVALGIRFDMPVVSDEYERRKFMMCLPMGLDILFGDSSEFYTRAIDGGLADYGLDTGSNFDVETGFASVFAQSSRPHELLDSISRVIANRADIVRSNEAEINIMRREIAGKAVFASSTVSSVRSLLLQPVYGDFPPRFSSEDILQELCVNDILGTLNRVFSAYPPVSVVSFPA